MKKSAAARRKTMLNPRPQSSPHTTDQRFKTKDLETANQSSLTGSKLSVSRARPATRKASTPTHDKTARSDSPDVSRIMPAETSTTFTSKLTTSAKPRSNLPSKKPLSSGSKISLADQRDFNYTLYKQLMFRRKIAEAELSKQNVKLDLMQKRMAEDQNILQKTTERLKNINFNKEVEFLHRLKNPNYGRVLETIDNSNCKEYLETVNSKLEQCQNQLKLRNIELPEGGANELFQIMKDTLAACEKLKADNNLEVPKVIAEIKENNNNTIGTLSSCMEMVPQVEDLMLKKLTLDTFSKDDI